MEDEQTEAAASGFVNLIYLGQRALLDTPGPVAAKTPVRG